MHYNPTFHGAKPVLCKIWGCHGGEDVVCGFLGCDTMLPGKWVKVVWRSLLILSSRWKIEAASSFKKYWWLYGMITEEITISKCVLSVDLSIYRAIRLNHCLKYLLCAEVIETCVIWSFMRIAVFWDVILCSLVEVCWSCRGMCCLHPQGRWPIHPFNNTYSNSDYLVLNDWLVVNEELGGI